MSDDPNILNCARAVLVGDPPDYQLGLEVQDGPFAGVTFAYTSFTVRQDVPVTDDGLVPIRFGLRIYKAPPDFRHDESFDEFARDMIMAWLSYINQPTFRQMVEHESAGGIH